jgi:hypothetical protein
MKQDTERDYMSVVETAHSALRSSALRVRIAFSARLEGARPTAT